MVYRLHSKSCLLWVNMGLVRTCFHTKTGIKQSFLPDQLQIYMYDVIAKYDHVAILGHGCDEHPFVTAAFLFPSEPKFGPNPCSSLMLIQYF